MTRTFASLLLALLLALSSQSMAVARGAAVPEGQMVICTGTGTMVVFVDAEGQPVEAPMLCPDATLQAITTLSAPMPLLFGADLGFEPPQQPAPAVFRAEIFPKPPSRAPPLKV